MAFTAFLYCGTWWQFCQVFFWKPGDFGFESSCKSLNLIFCTKVNMMQVYIKLSMPWIKFQSQTPKISISVSFSTLYFQNQKSNSNSWKKNKWSAYLIHMQWMRLFCHSNCAKSKKISWKNNSFSFELVSWPLQHFCTAGPDDNSAKSSSENREGLGLNPPVNQWIWFFVQKWTDFL